MASLVIIFKEIRELGNLNVPLQDQSDFLSSNTAFDGSKIITIKRPLERWLKARRKSDENGR